MCKCKNCGKEGYEISPKKFPKDFCSYHCYEEWSKFNKTPNCKCTVCGREMYLKPSRLKRIKHGITCSKECTYKLKSEYMSGKGNHQYGLIGDKNSSFNGTETVSNLGYIFEYCPGHPKPCDRSIKGSRVRQHRLIVERNYDKFDPKYFEEINGWVVLKDEYDVHHINEIKTDNRLSNLQILTRSEHTTYHNNIEHERSEKYKAIIGVLKQGELLETPEVDNQQPSLDRNILEGSETSNRVPNKDSNITTSALLQQIKNIAGEDIVRPTHITEEESVEQEDKELLG